MSAWDWSPYAVGGATRADTFSGMKPEFQTALQSLFAAAPPDIRQNLRVMSGFRSPQRQAQLYQQALQKYGSPEAARKWVAPPGRSGHNHGHAADLRYLNDAALKWAHANAANYNLAFPLSNENWHIELAGARGGKPAGGSISSLYAGQPTAAPSPASPVAPAGAPSPMGAPALPMLGGDPLTGDPLAGPENLGAIASLFVQGQQQRQKLREDERAAEQAKRAALFDIPSLYAV